MSIFTTKPIEELTKLEFKELIKSNKIEPSPHVLDHLSESQRKVFKEEELIYMISKENPRKIYKQENGRYAIYYRRKDGYRKIIIEIENEKVVIVSFIDTLELPKIIIQNET